MVIKSNWVVIYLVIITTLTGGRGLFAQSMQKNDYSKYAFQLKYSDMDSWYYMQVRESSVIGGNFKKLYQIGNSPCSESSANDTEKDHESEWATTNIFARIGANVAVTCVFPEIKNDGFCCRMESIIKTVDVIGIKIKVLVSGAIFLGNVYEPVRSIKYPIRQLNHGIAFTQKPKAIQFSYKYKAGQNRKRIYYSSTPVSGPDKGEFCMILQKRWEDSKGNVFAKRIGGARSFLNDSGNKWVNDTTISILYGDISRETFFNPSTMGLIPQISELYVKNSRDKMVPLTETSWDKCNDSPTHLILYFTSSFEGINYTGSPGSVFWIDNVRFIY